MSDDRQKLVDCIYEAAIVPAEWPFVLDQLAQVGDGVGALLFSLSGGDLRWSASPALQDHFQQYLVEGWPTRTDRAARLLAARHAGFLDDLDVYTEEELQQEPVFAEFLRPRGMGRGAATGIPVPTGDTLIVSIERDYPKLFMHMTSSNGVDSPALSDPMVRLTLTSCAEMSWLETKIQENELSLPPTIKRVG